MVSVAVVKCLPLAQYLASVDEALSYRLLQTICPGVPLPTPEPLPTVQDGF